MIVGSELSRRDRPEPIQDASHKMLELVLANIPQGVFWKDRNSIYLGCNQIVCRALGLNSPAELIGKTDFELPSLTREQAAHFIDIDQRVMTLDQPMAAIVEPMSRFDGVTIWLETVKVPLHDADGRVIGVLGTWQDITERQQAHEAVLRSEEYYRSLATAMSELVWMSNAQGSQLRVTPPLEEFLGFTREQVRGAGWKKALHPDDQQQVEAAWSAAVAAGSRYECEFRLLRGDGRWRYIHSRGIPIRNRQGEIQEWVGVGVDVTDRRLAEEGIRQLNLELEQRVRERTAELELANKELEAFSYSVSHDLRAPLRAIDGFSRILLAEHASSLSPVGQEFLNDIRTNTKLMGQLVDDLLSFSRLGRQPIKKQRVCSAELVQECMNELDDQHRGRSVDFRIEGLADSWADPKLLKRVWINLISNALKYSSKKDHAVIVIGSRPGALNQMEFFIRDNGVGFDMRYIQKLFGVFQRLHRAEDYEGTGVGLAIVQRVIHRHGGRVFAEGEINRGATFHFTLPEPVLAAPK